MTKKRVAPKRRRVKRSGKRMITAGKANKPWEALGLSKSTYYREQAKKRGTDGVGSAAPGRGSRNSTQDAVSRALAKQARRALERTVAGKRADDAVTLTETAELMQAVVDVLRKAGC